MYVVDTYKYDSINIKRRINCEGTNNNFKLHERFDSIRLFDILDKHSYHLYFCFFISNLITPFELTSATINFN